MASGLNFCSFLNCADAQGYNGMLYADAKGYEGIFCSVLTLRNIKAYFVLC